MSKFAHLQTGVGTSTTSSTFFGPFETPEKADAFVEMVREEYKKLKCASIMAICLYDELPRGRGVLEPVSFKGFMKT